MVLSRRVKRDGSRLCRRRFRLAMIICFRWFVVIDFAVQLRVWRLVVVDTLNVQILALGRRSVSSLV